VKNRVPWDVVFGLDAEERFAYVVIFGQLAGGEFDFTTGRWKVRD
jgi:hypothetical protein